MGEDRIHQALSADGTTIAGRVVGDGAPLVLVHGGLGSGESWIVMLPHLARDFRCYLLSTRARGLSGDHPDHARERYFEDIATYIDSIGEPVNVLAWSSGATYALGAATLVPSSVRRLALYEPAIALSPWPLDALADAGRRVAAEPTAESLLALLDLMVEPTDEERVVLADPLVVERMTGFMKVAMRERRATPLIQRRPDRDARHAGAAHAGRAERGALQGGHPSCRRSAPTRTRERDRRHGALWCAHRAGGPRSRSCAVLQGAGTRIRRCLHEVAPRAHVGLDIG